MLTCKEKLYKRLCTGNFYWWFNFFMMFFKLLVLCQSEYLEVYFYFLSTVQFYVHCYICCYTVPYDCYESMIHKSGIYHPSNNSHKFLICPKWPDVFELYCQLFIFLHCVDLCWPCNVQSSIFPLTPRSDSSGNLIHFNVCLKIT